MHPSETLGPLRSFLAVVGAAFIHLLMRLFGRVVPERAVPWLQGPIGGDYIGDRPYEECAQREGLHLTRGAQSGGLLSDFQQLNGATFTAQQVHPEIRRFYEQTAAYRMDVWSESHFPGSLGLWLLVTTLSRKVNQLNFPLRMLDTAKGMDSEIVLLREPGGRVRYAGWYRRLQQGQRVIYTGFYMSEQPPRAPGSCVKVVFPMPQGNATVLLRPSADVDGSLLLSSAGRGFGDAGFYRVRRLSGERLLVWRVRTLLEQFRVYVDERGTLRCDHAVRFLGLPILHLHYRIERARA